MTRNFGVLAPAFLVLAFVGYACTQGEVVEGPAHQRSGGLDQPGDGGQHGRHRRHHRRRQHRRRRGAPPAAAAPPAGRQHHRPRRHHRHRRQHRSRGGTTGTPATPRHRRRRQHRRHRRHRRHHRHGRQHGRVRPTASRSRRTATSRCPFAGWLLDGLPVTYADTFGSMVMPTSFSTCGTPCMLRMTGNIVRGGRAELFVRRHGLQSRPDPGRRHDQHAGDAEGLRPHLQLLERHDRDRRRASCPGHEWHDDLVHQRHGQPRQSRTARSRLIATTPRQAPPTPRSPSPRFELNLAGGTAAGTINVTLTSVTEN